MEELTIRDADRAGEKSPAAAGQGRISAGKIPMRPGVTGTGRCSASRQPLGL